MNKIKPPHFDNNEVALHYWRVLAESNFEEMERMQKDSEEYMLESQQLEKEFEATIDQNERKIKELTLLTNRLQNELETFKTKMDKLHKENSNFEQEINTLKTETVQMNNYIRELEQKNETLETSHRILEGSIVDIETAFNSAIERNAILELEVDEKESMKEKLQRLIDERRELQQELLVKGRSPEIEKTLKSYRTLPRILKKVEKNPEIAAQSTPKKSKMKFKAFRSLYAFCTRKRSS